MFLIYSPLALPLFNISLTANTKQQYFSWCYSHLWKKRNWKWLIQSCPTLCDPMDYTVHGILQARILERVAFPFSRGSSQPRVIFLSSYLDLVLVSGSYWPCNVSSEVFFSIFWKSLRSTDVNFLILSGVHKWSHLVLDFGLFCVFLPPLLCQQRSVYSRLWFSQWSCMDARVGLWRKLSPEELTLLNCGVR